MNKEEILRILQSVTDPEIQVLTLEDMGIIRDINIDEDEKVEVVITPTYTGCPAMDLIAVNIKSALQEAGIQNVEVKTTLSPAWSTDWLSEEGRKKLKAYGIAPPEKAAGKSALLGLDGGVTCPRCNSTNTRLISEFGSTACKALYQCNDCLEPFDYFKCI
ncbi:MAG: phenylacetate-CoA oxygenase subunit PaaJ [Saprospirales bacterium]|nr:phenylacetate-CoA oxygenase subunit PaaJ [Saprospirales bacterium]